MKTKKIYTILALLFACFSLASCIDDDFVLCEKDYDVPEAFKEGYSLNLTITLDKLGGTTRAEDALSYIDDYIDPERLRILFFDSKEKFLFESKSRWVKQLASTSNGYSQWLVSVPMFSYGNDVAYDWDWEAIRSALTEGSFKIAILANRPGEEWCPEFSDTKINEDWFDNNGPYWGKDDVGNKRLFDLHHSQYDPIYTGKNTRNKGTKAAPEYESGYYEHIAKVEEDPEDPVLGKKLWMSPTSSWVYWGDGKGYKGVDVRTYDTGFPELKIESGKTEYDYYYYKYTIRPDLDHPIPMYGLQEFDKIDKNTWIKGTPFNLSNITEGATLEQQGYNFKSIALLRSVVKLELLIPTSFSPSLVAMWYPNIYARCEPMNVWEPTDKIWKEDHERDCEWKNIMNYGPISSTQFTAGGTTRDTDKSIENYQKTISWFYGSWKDTDPEGNQRWPFEGGDFSGDIASDEEPYPNIFNPCIQRNKMVICNEQGYLGRYYENGIEYHRYVVYTGERSMNDPNTLPDMKGTAYAVSWMFKDETTQNYYCFPIADYSEDNTLARNCIGPYKSYQLRTKSGDLQLPDYFTLSDEGRNEKESMFTYANKLKDVNSTKNMPWPLLRNHVYRIILNSKRNVILSWNKEPDLSTLTTEEMKNTGSSNNVATWSNGISIMIMRSDKAQSAGSNITIDGNPYKTIKASKGAQNKLTLPEGKQTSKITLYSYVNSDVPQNSLIDYPTSQTGITCNNSNTTFEKSFTVNKKSSEAIKFNSNGTTNGATLKVTGGFKKGDKIEVAGAISNGNAEKRAYIEIYAKINGEYKKVFTSQGVIDVVTTPNKDAVVETYILGEDTEELCIARGGNTGLYVNLLKVTHPNLESVQPSYWREVNGTTLDDTDRFTSYKDYENPDRREYVFDEPVNEVTFTNDDNAQVCYVVVVEVDDVPNTAKSTRGVGNGLSFEIKSEDLHSKSLKLE